MGSDPHKDARIFYAGAPVEEAAAVLIALHGRGSDADDILGLAEAIAPANWALVAPQAVGHTWYPNSFLAPRAENEPYLSSALWLIKNTVDRLVDSGVETKRIALCGFSQGACLSTEFVGRNPTRYAAVVAFTGGLVGPLGEPISLAGDLEGTPILLSSGDPDPHVPWARVVESAELLTAIGSAVSARRYARQAHTVWPAEIAEARTLLENALESKTA
jgi:phospholipase/carboxylesterase